jgi:hypothetical protein
MKLAGTNLCIAADSRSENSLLHLRKCNGDVSLQNFALNSSTHKISHNTGYWMDIQGAGWWGQNDGAGQATNVPSGRKHGP